jgi:PAS domain S-box-containing protein
MVKKLRLKTWILIPAAVLLAVPLVGFLYVVWNLQEYHLNRDFSSCLKSSDILLKDHVAADTKVLSAALEVLCRDENLQAVWRQHDRNLLESCTKTLFKEMREKYDVTHFYFHEQDGICFLRVHQPERFGDVIKRQTLVQSRKTGRLASGVELGALGTLTLRVVKPWTIDGQVAGYLELGEEIGQIHRNIAEELGVDVAILLDKKLLDRKGWESGMPLHDRSTNWDDLPDEVVVECHPAGISPELLAKLAAYPNDELNAPAEIDLHGVSYLAGARELHDFSGRDVGRIVLFQNIAPQRAELRTSMIRLSKYFLITATLGLLGIYFYLKYVERLVGLFQDRMLLAIESRKLAQEKHISDLLPFRKAFEGTTDALAILDVNRRLQYINPAFRKLFGYAMEELEIQGGIKTLYADSTFAVKVYLQVSQGRNYSGEVEMRAKDHRALKVFLRGNPILNDAGEMIGILAVYTDLTEHKSVERELQLKAGELAKCRQNSMNAEEEQKQNAAGKAVSSS